VTSSSRRFALDVLVVALVAFAAGCGKRDGAKEYAAAKAAYEVRDLRKAEKLVGESVRLAPGNVDALVTAARIKIDLGQMAEAKDFVDMAKLFAGDDVDVRLLDAYLAYYQQEYPRALEVFNGIANDASMDAKLRSQALSGVGVVEMSRNETDLARIAFLKAARFDRRNPAAWYHLGQLYHRLGYNEAALEQFDIYVRLEETASRRVQEVQRNVIPKLKDEIARQAAERPGASDRDSAASAKALAEAETAWNKGQYKTAKSKYLAAFSSDPLSFPAAIGVAKAFEKTDATAEGQKKTFEYYKTACMLRPGAISTFLKTGELAMKLGHYATAVEIYSRALAADPSNFMVVDGLIRALRKTGGTAKANTAAAYQAYRDLITKKR
jgi:tetratricopeptide (TPR) repeat protein